MEQLSINSNSKQGYTISNSLIRYWGWLVIGDCETLKGMILQTMHDSPLGGHSGIQNTYRKVKQVFFWLSLKKSVMEYILQCDVCKRCKHESVAKPCLLQPLEVLNWAWANITMDFVEGLPRLEGKNCVLVVVD